MAGEAVEVRTGITDLLAQAIEARRQFFDERHQSAFRLFNGFSEGEPNLVIDLYASTLVFHDYASSSSTIVLDHVAYKDLGPNNGQEELDSSDPIPAGSETATMPERDLRPVYEAQQFIRSEFSWIHAGITKNRNAKIQVERRGVLLFGDKLDRKIQEHGVWYAIDLTMNRDASFYFDTRNLRRWLIENMRGKSVLNTFAYTGSLGVAALAGAATRVVQLDLNRQFLNLAKDSYTLNGFPIHRSDFITADFFPAISILKRRGETFDCVIIDPPFFSTTSKGRVDQEQESARLINKVRPLISDGGTLVAINNALYVSGRDYLHTLESLCADGYLSIQELISVPEDMVGYKRINAPITDPSPFNHSTKIAILGVKRKPIR